jgi:hypothetical protein
MLSTLLSQLASIQSPPLLSLQENLRSRLNSNNLSRILLLRVIILHHRESQNLLNRVVIGDKHDHTIDTHTPTTSRGKTIFKGSTEVLINKLSLVVSLILLVCLLLESKTLVEGVIQLSVSIDDLLLTNESLESFTKSNTVTVVLGQRRHHLRVSSDEGGVDTLLLNELSDELVEHTCVGLRGRTVDLVGLKDLLQELVGLLGVKLVSGRELLSSSLLKRGHHVDTLPGLGPVYVVDLTGLSVELGGVSSGNLLDHGGNKVLGNLDKVVVVGVGPVELTGGEFRVVGKVDTLVTELATNFVDTLKTSNNKHLEVQLGGDTHEHVHVEVVVVGDEGLGGGSSSNLVHHGSLNFDEIPGVEVLTDERNDLGTGDEDIARTVVHDKVEVTLTVTSLLVLETEVLRGKHTKTRGEKNDLLSEDRELSRVVLLLGVGTTGESNNSDDVSTVKVLVLGKVISNSLLGLSHDLDLDSLGAEVVETKLVSGGTVSVDTSSDTDLNLGLGFSLGEVGPLRDDIGDLVGDVELVGVRVDGALGLTELVDRAGTDLEVLL